MLDIEQYPHVDYKLSGVLNKEQFPQTTLTWLDYEVFNSLLFWAKENCKEGLKTPSGGIQSGPENRFKPIYLLTIRDRVSIELVIAHPKYGCYKFVIKGKKGPENTLSGQQALKTLYRTAESFGVLDILKSGAVDSETGRLIKTEIEAPIIELLSNSFAGREFKHVHHLDLNSSYFSRIVDAVPDLKELGDWLYDNRRMNNGLFKHVMTNAIGAMQSRYCIDIFDKYFSHTVPFQLSKFSKIAINETNRLIEHYLITLQMQGFEPLLVNTDGIWYQAKDGSSQQFHDGLEGYGLGYWKHDHADVDLYIRSVGAYQFIEAGKVKTVLRGQCGLDYIKPDRETWNWHEIDQYPVFKFTFSAEEGIKKDG